MRVLGVDPGLTRCGVGVVESQGRGAVSFVAVGVIRTPVTDAPELRLLALQDELDHWFDRYEPEAVSVERVFAKANIKGIMGIGQASAIPMIGAARRGLELALHTPTEVKAAVTGSGTADKAQVTAMVTRILRLDAPPKPADAADALALAICHIWRGRMQARVDSGVAAPGAVAAAARGRNRWQEAIAAHQAATSRGAGSRKGQS